MGPSESRFAAARELIHSADAVATVLTWVTCAFIDIWFEMKITTIRRKIEKKKTGSSFDFENVSILHVCPQWNQRLFLEAWYSNKEENSINQHVEFLLVYLKLKNF